MKPLSIAVWVGVFAVQMPFNVLALNVEKMAENNYRNLQKMKQSNQQLIRHIEQLQEQQKVSQKAIAELFQLMEQEEPSIETEGLSLAPQTLKKNYKEIYEENHKAKKLYTYARNLLVDGQYDQSINSFSQYLDSYPNNRHTADSVYWLGRAYMAKNDYANAKRVFIEFQQNHPQHYKYANSMHELAVSYHELRAHQEAAAVLELMIERFPNHAAVSRAETLLKKLRPLTKATKIQPVIKNTQPN